MKSIRHLIFDLDGTLIDSSEGVVEAVNYSLRMTGQTEQPAATIRPFIGYPLEVMYPQFTDVPYDELYAHFKVRAAETVVAATSVLPGVQDSLIALKDAGYRMAIATTKIRCHVDSIVAKLGWASLFEALVGGDDVAAVKPAPDAFVKALSDLGAAPTDAIVIGDTVNDVAAAQAVPMRVVAVNSPYGNNDEMLALRPDHYLDSITGLQALLNDIADS